MKTATIGISRNSVLALESPVEIGLRYACAVAISISVLAYGYLLVQTTLNVIALRQAASASAVLQSELSSLESKYFAAASQITLDSTGELGLVTMAQPQYIAMSESRNTIALK